MKKLSTFALLSALTLAGLSGADALAGKKEDKQAEKKEWETGAPAQVKQLAFLEGEWDVTTESRKGADEGFEISKGVSVYSWILDGSVLQETYTGSWAGKPMTALTWLTWNRYQGAFEETTVSNMGASVFHLSEGQFENGKLVLFAEKKHEDKVIQTRRTFERVGDDKIIATVEVNKDGTWMLKARDTLIRK